MDSLAPLSPHFSLSFSPSKARAQRAQAADWHHVDTWLSSKYQGRSVPAFERNEDTLKVLLALVAANEKADEERDILWSVEKRALVELEAGLERNDDDVAILEALKTHLTPSAQQSLEALAATSVAVDSPRPDSESIAHSIVNLTIQSQTLSQQLIHVGNLQSYLQGQLTALRSQLRELQPEKDATRSSFNVPLSMPQQTQEWTRNTKMLKSRIIDYEERLNGLNSSLADNGNSISIEDLERLEQNVLEIRHRVALTEAQVKAFEGLPPDRDAARAEVKRLEREVGALKEERDQLFAAMVDN